VLIDLLDGMEHSDQWGEVFQAYTDARKPAGDAIMELALRNYIEMRDKTGDPKFLLQKRIESKLATIYPGRWIPLYSQVTFSHTPYHHALEAGLRQDRIMADILSRPKIEENWDSPEVAQAAIEALEQTH
jgi:kynurenine 3-monooxygenase